MNRSIGWLLVVILSCGTGAVMRDLVAPAQAANRTGLSYEYATVKLAEFEQAEIAKVTSEYGRQGWRLSQALRQNPENAYLIFERPLAR